MAVDVLRERHPHVNFGVTRDGRIFFIDEKSRTTSWLHPLKRNPVQTGHRRVSGLPDGWEQAVTPEGAIYFIDHNTQTTTFEHPVTGRTVSHGSPKQSSTSAASPPNSPGGGPPKSPIRSPTKLRALKAPAAKREETAMVTIKGWLYRQESGGLKSWKKRWCVLADFGLFFYKDDKEHHSVGSILLPSYQISQSAPGESNKKFSFKAEHNNMKTYFFASDSQIDMERWIKSLKLAAALKGVPKKSPEPNNNTPKLIPKSAFMEWDEDEDEDVKKRFSGPPEFPPSNKSNSQSAFGPYQDQGQPRLSPEKRNTNQYPENRDPPHRRYEHFPTDPRAQVNHRPQNRQTDRARPLSEEIQPSRNYPRDNSLRPDDPQNRRSYNEPHPQERSYNEYDPRNVDPRRNTQDNRHPTYRDEVDARLGYPNRIPDYSRAAYDQEKDRENSHNQDNVYSKPVKKLNRDLSPHERFEERGGHNRTKEYRIQPSSPRHKADDNPYVHMSQHDPRSVDRPDIIPHSNHSRETSETSNYGYYSPQRAEAQQMDRLYGDERGYPQDPQILRHGRIKPEHDENYPGRSNSQHPKEPPRLYLTQDQPPVNQSSQPLQQANRENLSLPVSQNDLYVDIPHTYVNIGDALSHRNGDQISPAPHRPPLPSAVRSQYVEELAQAKTPKTSQELLDAERALEIRMQQPAYFNYPTPTSENAPHFPRGGNNYQGNHLHPGYVGYPHQNEAGHGNQNGYKSNANNLQDIDNSEEPRIIKKFQKSTMLRSGSREVLQSLDASDLARRRMSSPDNSVTRQQSKNESGDEETFLKEQISERDLLEKNNIMHQHMVEQRMNDSHSVMNESRDQDVSFSRYPGERQELDTSTNSLSGPQFVENSRRPGGQRNSLNGSNLSRVNNLFIQNAPMNDKITNRSFDGTLPQTSKAAERPTMNDYRYTADDETESETDVKKRLSTASSQVSRREESETQRPHPQSVNQRPDFGGRKGGKKPGMIHTVKEDPDMPDSQVIATAGLPGLNKKYPIGGSRIRMSISAGDLLGKTHDELVLMLIQLRRDQAAEENVRHFLRQRLEEKRHAEHRYRQIVQQSGGPVDAHLEEEHNEYTRLKYQLIEVEKGLEVYRPLVNLVHNMVNMGSLYGGDNYMMATQYRKHLLSPEEYTPPKKMIEFSRKHQEEEMVQSMKEEIRQLNQDEADLEEKLERLYELDRLLQEQSYKVISYQEDKELLEKALHGILRQQDMSRDNPRDLDNLLHQQRTIEKELSRVMHYLAEASKELEETTAENNKVEHEVALLRSKVHGDLNRSKSAPSLSEENYKNKVKMEKDLARVQDMMVGLTEQQAELSEAMKRFRRLSSGGGMENMLEKPEKESPKTNKNKSVEKLPSTYMETDLDTGDSKDLSQVQQVLHSYNSLPRGGYSQNTSPTDVGRYETLVSQNNVSLESSSLSPGGGPMENSDGQWDISEADDNTKRFFGIIPKEKPKVLTVRDVKRQSELRKENHKTRREDVSPDPSWTYDGQGVQSEEQPTSGSHGNHPVYENLPPVNSSKPWSSVLPSNPSSAPSSRRSSSLHLMGPRPFVPFHLQSNTPSPVTHVESPVTVTTNSSSFHQPQTDGVVKATRIIVQPPFNDNETNSDNGTAPVSTHSSTGMFNVKRTPKGRYMTISSSEPVKLETSFIQPTSPNTAAGDLMTNRLYVPNKVEIPERYIPDSDDESITEEEKIKREEKAEKIKRLLTKSSVQHSLSQPDVSQVGEIHQQAKEQKIKTAHLLAVSQELAKQVTLKSRQAAVERAKRRKTWSGSPSKVTGPVLDPEDLEVGQTLGSSENLSMYHRRQGSSEFIAPHHRRQENMYM
ncbi:uncharacterized protein LOC133182524 isoform X2 [Saccostrea echinata]|uniref:uncharacterized protein LOC133182524 isoform X2 n=1 Tax=Saccostrea echinata TaxID=191078 RepID=UPI002A81C8D1|nr:uncharacterized protein LOC133182524 isoform X2 [Saccostrea echinata]